MIKKSNSRYGALWILFEKSSNIVTANMNYIFFYRIALKIVLYIFFNVSVCKMFAIVLYIINDKVTALHTILQKC